MDGVPARSARESSKQMPDQDPRRPRTRTGPTSRRLGSSRQADDERPLDGVVGEIDVAEDPSRDPEQAVPMRPDQDGEGVLVTALG